MRWVMALTFSTAAICAVAAAAAPSKPPHAKSAVKKTSTHSRTRRSKTRHASVAAYQLQPAPERYQEIQKALGDRGYFKGEANGQWGPDSVDALQRFQTDQKIPNDGKINSLSLIDLGLGPKHDSAVASTPIPAPSSSEAGAPVPEPPPN